MQLLLGAAENGYKFVAAGAVELAHIAHGFGEALGGSLNQLVAGLVAQGVVGALQLVQIHQNQGLFFQCPCLLELLTVLQERPAVFQSGELVVQGVFSLFFQLPGDVPFPNGNHAERHHQQEHACQKHHDIEPYKSCNIHPAWGKIVDGQIPAQALKEAGHSQDAVLGLETVFLGILHFG